MAIFNRFKKALGIEGVKVQVLSEDSYEKSSGRIQAQIKLESLSDLTIDNIQIKLIERYERGRKKDKLINEMTIGKTTLKKTIVLQKEEVKIIDFQLDYVIPESPMDALEKENFLYKGVVKLAKLAKGVKSDYRLEALVEVIGTKLDAVAQTKIDLK